MIPLDVYGICVLLECAEPLDLDDLEAVQILSAYRLSNRRVTETEVAASESDPSCGLEPRQWLVVVSRFCQ